MNIPWFVSFFGSQAKFARALNVQRPIVNRYVKNNKPFPDSWIGRLYSSSEGRAALKEYEAAHKKEAA